MDVWAACHFLSFSSGSLAPAIRSLQRTRWFSVFGFPLCSLRKRKVPIAWTQIWSSTNPSSYHLDNSSQPQPNSGLTAAIPGGGPVLIPGSQVKVRHLGKTAVSLGHNTRTTHRTSRLVLYPKFPWVSCWWLLASKRRSLIPCPRGDCQTLSLSIKGMVLVGWLVVVWETRR